MSHENELLDIERTKLELEKRRDRHAHIRFLVGSVFVALLTTGASFYLNAKQ